MNNTVIEKINFVNEAVLKYEEGSPERIELERELTNVKSSFIDIPAKFEPGIKELVFFLIIKTRLSESFTKSLKKKWR